MIEKSVEDMGVKELLQKMYQQEFTEPQLTDDMNLSEFRNGISFEVSCVVELSELLL